MSEQSDRIQISFGSRTDEITNYVFRSLPDEIVDEIELDRSVADNKGVARELVTSAAVITCATTISWHIFKLIDRWMENERRKAAGLLIYQSAKENPEALKILAEIEMKYVEVSARQGRVRTSKGQIE